MFGVSLDFEVGYGVALRDNLVTSAKTAWSLLLQNCSGEKVKRPLRSHFTFSGLVMSTDPDP